MFDYELFYSSITTEKLVSPPLTQGDGDSVFNDLVLSDAPNNLVLTVTMEQYTKMLSALWNGAYTTYPEDVYNVVYPLLKAGKVEFCAQIIQCIQEDEDVANALRDFYLTQNGFASPDSNSLAMGTAIISVPSCDPDEIWGNSVSLWQTINKFNIDFLEVVNEAVNNVELLGDIIEFIPVINSLPVDAALELINDMSEFLLDAYNSGLTVTLENQIKCDLFCIGVDNCGFTMEQLTDYFQSYFSIDLNSMQFTDFLDWMVTQSHTGEAIVYLLTCFQLYIVSTGNQWFGVYFPDFYGTAAKLGEPDNDWSILCDDCPVVWSHTFNLLEEFDSEYLTINAMSGTWIDGLGIRSTFRPIGGVGSPNEQFIGLTIAVSPTTEVTSLQRVGTLAGARVTAPNTELDFIVSPDPIVRVNHASGAFDVTADVLVNCDGIVVYVAGGTSSTVYSYLTSVTITGTGVNPFT